MKPLQNSIQFIAGRAEELPLDARILNGSSFITLLFGLLALLANWLAGGRPELNFPCLAGILLGFLAWYLGRHQKQFLPSLIVLIIAQLLGLSIAFIVNGGIKGPVPNFYVALAPIYIFILQPKVAIPVTLFLFISIVALYLAEIMGLLPATSYQPSDTVSSHDYFLALSLNFALIVLIITTVKLLFMKEQEKAISSNQAKSRFLANISHEIRTPMNAILGMTELALARSTDAQQKKWLEGSHIAATHLLSLIEDLLDLSSIDAGKLVINSQPSDLSLIVTSVVNILQPLANQKKLLLQSELNNLPPLVETDPLRLRQILVNLINNAIKYTDNGMIQIKVSIQEKAHAHTLLHFSITDTGIGIEAKDQQYIFDIFARGSQIVNSRKGSGLGLAITKQLVQKMGGEIWLESAPNLGTTFFFTLPVIEIHSDVSLSSNKNFTASNKITASQKILLVEDNATNIDVAKHMLQQAGYDVSFCTNGEQALGVLAHTRFSAVLMDLEMPIKNGYETITALRKGHAGSLNQSVPIIAVTAHALAEYKKKALAAGAQYFITKPIHASSLIETLQLAIS